MKAYQFFIKLEDVEPIVWRRFVIPAETTFKRLHDTIQFTMGWQDAHLFEFDLEKESNKNRLEIVEDEEMYEQHQFNKRQAEMKNGTEIVNKYEKRAHERVMKTDMRLAHKTKLPKYVENNPEFIYRYDYGDDWLHRVRLEKIVLDYEYGHPVLLEGEGVCPPEDIGGPGGYQHFVEVYNDSSHPEHKWMKEWAGDRYPKPLDIPHINKMMMNLLKLKKVKVE
jgi:hypothetical protein